MKRCVLISAVVMASIPVQAFGALLLTKYDGVTPKTYSNGGGTGFGGTLGNGTISMDRVGGNLNIAFTPGNALNDIVALYLDTRSGGFTDAQMNDQADGGRMAVSNLSVNGNDTYPVLPDFGVAIGNFGSVLFELNAGNTNGHLIFHIFNPAPNISIPLATLGSPFQIDWFAGYTSGSGFNSNESLPNSAALNGGGNPGFDIGSTYENFNRFVTVPEASTIVVWGLVLMTAGFARRRFA